MLWFPYLQYTLLAPPTWISSLSSEFVIKSLYGFLIKIGSRKTLSPRKAGDVRALSLLCLPDVTGGLARSGIWQLLVVKGAQPGREDQMAVRHTDARAASALQASVGAGAKSGLIQAHRDSGRWASEELSVSPGLLCRSTVSLEVQNTVPEAGSPKSRCQQGQASSVVSREGCFLASSSFWRPPSVHDAPWLAAGSP